MQRFIIFAFLLFCAEAVVAQETETILTPYNHWNEDSYYGNSSLNHTAFRFHLYNDTTSQDGKGSLWKRKIFDEHLLKFNQEEFHLFVDFLPDFQIGTSSGRRGSKKFWQNTRGFRVSGNIGSKIYFESEDYETQQSFPGYVDSAARISGIVIPRFGNHHPVSKTGTYDFNFANARIVYMPNNLLQFELGYGRNFIGDGYRSMLLSDWSFNYPYLRATVQTKAIEYSFMLSQYTTPGTIASAIEYSFPRKWGQTFYLDWHFSKHGNIGLLESVIWPDETAGKGKDIAPTMFSPIIFLHGSHSPSGVENYTLTGLNAKYEVLPRTFLYGQFAVSDFLRNGDWSKRYSFQAGIRSSAVFNVDGLSFIGEFDRAKPYMYAGNAEEINYSHYDQPLADPFGNNFKEAVAVISYRYKKWMFRGEALYSGYNRNISGLPEDNAGGNICEPLPDPQQAIANNGVHTKLRYGNLRVGYLLNPKINLRLEGGITIRKESTGNANFKDNIFVFGLRSSFQDLIQDF